MHQIHNVIRRLALNVGTPRALAVKLLVEREEWAELQQLRCKPQDYVSAGAYFRDNLITEILRKCDLPTSVDKEAAAVQSFWACEAKNCTTNAYLTRYLPSNLFIEDGDMPVYEFITRWRKEVGDVLGNLPDHLDLRFSGGATYADTGMRTTIPDKMSSAPTIYERARCLLPLWGDTSWARSLVRDRPNSSDPLTVRGNIFFTVPKDGTKFRGCCKEASIPIAYQLACGKEIRRKLPRIGIQLKSGQAKHKLLAREASVSNDQATLDMSDASDTTCRVLPQLLLRSDWYELLNSLRAHYTRIQGKWVRLEKFSSMGNGFTFELETLIFATLARVVVRDEGGDPDKVSCYGDDLIVPSCHYRSVVAALRLFGYTPNMKKTFAEGPFRESCGGDFWLGVPVRACYIENLPDEPQQWISLANSLRRVACIDSDVPSPERWDIIRSAWLYCVSRLPKEIARCRGPSHLGDIVLHDDPSTWTFVSDPRKFRKELRGSLDSTVWNSSWESGYVLAYLPIPSILPWDHWLPSVQLASCTLGLSSKGVSQRDTICGYRIGTVNATLTSPWLPSTEIRLVR